MDDGRPAPRPIEDMGTECDEHEGPEHAREVERESKHPVGEEHGASAERQPREEAPDVAGDQARHTPSDQQQRPEAAPHGSRFDDVEIVEEKESSQGQQDDAEKYRRPATAAT